MLCYNSESEIGALEIRPRRAIRPGAAVTATSDRKVPA